MRIFNNINEFSRYILSIDLGVGDSLDKILDKTQKNIRKRHGRYPSDISWPQLSPVTIKLKSRGNVPLLETGELRESYKKFRKKRGEGSVKSMLNKAQKMEYGFVSAKGVNTPARPVAKPESIKAKQYAKEIAKQELKNSLSKKLS